jgi:hypothetical protein
VNFIRLIKNKYGNFVLLRLLKKFSIEEKPRLKDVLIKTFKMSGNKEKIKLNKILNSLKIGNTH